MQVHRYSRRLWAALLAEFLGLAIFQIYGGSANDDVAALANGITLAVIGAYQLFYPNAGQAPCHMPSCSHRRQAILTTPSEVSLQGCVRTLGLR